MSPVGSPGRALVVARTRGEATQIRSVRAHRPQVEVSLPRGERDGVALRRPARLGVEARLGDPPYVRSLGVHDEDVRAAGPLGDEGYLASGGRPAGLGIDARVGSEPTEGPGGQVQQV